MNEFSKVKEYKYNTQNSTTFLYTNNEHIGTEIKNIKPIVIAPKNINI